MKHQLKHGGKLGLNDLGRIRSGESAMTCHRAVMVGRYNKLVNPLAYCDVGLGGPLRVVAK